MKVKECMSNNVYCVKPETKIYEVVKLMNENHIGSIPICDNNSNVHGIVTDRDILLRCVACDKDTKTTNISEIMTSNVYTCNEDDDMQNAQNKMAKFQIRRLPVCNANNKIVGIISLGDLAENKEKLGDENLAQTIGCICNCEKGENAE